MRCFVFISNIPEFLLQPMHDNISSDADGRRRANRDPRYERLRSLLAEHTSGTMLVMHLETKGYGLALYASEEEALSACKATITPTQPGMQYEPLRLRILEKEKPPPPEPVYCPTVRIEGDEVAKSALALTRGLELAYRGRAVPRWCPSTLAHEDCPLGTSCHRIHRAMYQRTLRKRPRVQLEDGATEEDRERIARLVADGRAAEEVLVPLSLRVQPPLSLYVRVEAQELEQLLMLRHSCSNEQHSSSTNASTSGDENNVRKAGEVQRVLAERVRATLESTPEGRELQSAPFFLRASFPGGAPWDWALHSPSGMTALRARCPLPVNGAPTPLDRDLLCQRVLYHVNELNAFTEVSAALHALSSSERVTHAFLTFMDEWSRRGGQRCVKEGEGEHGRSGTESGIKLPALYLVVRPWLRLPTVGCEASAFLERGGRVVRGVVQRYGQLRLMTSAAATTATTTANTAANATDARVAVSEGSEPTGFVVIGAGQDEAAEAALETELRARSRLLQEAVATLQRHLVSLDKGKGVCESPVPPNAAWCAQLAIVPTARAGGSSGGRSGQVQGERVVVLSFTPYRRALEECPMYTHLTASSGATGAATAPAAAEVSWNTQKHAYVPLFSRETLERLRPI